MKTIDIKSLIIGGLLTSTIFLGVAAVPSGAENSALLGAAAEAAAEKQYGLPSLWWLLAIVLVGGQILYAAIGPAFHWPSLFRVLGTLSFAAFALTITGLLVYEPRGTTSSQVIMLLLTPFTAFISCYLIAHVLETFDKIKENTWLARLGAD
jgi:hypothetical protein